MLHKLQIQHRMKMLLLIQNELSCDALDIAICHIHYQKTALRLQSGLLK